MSYYRSWRRGHLVARKKTGLRKIISEAGEYRFGTKVYFSKSFVDRIEINLANISSSPEDEFKLENLYYSYPEFTCELCGHQHCLYTFEILNIKTGKILKVGSECISHFKDKGVDIDLAEGLMKRILKATVQARKEVINKLGKEAWNALTDEERKSVPYYDQKNKIDELGRKAVKNLSREERAKLTINAYMVVQAQELLAEVAGNKHMLSKEEMEHILDLGLQAEVEKAEAARQEAVLEEKRAYLLNDIYAYFEKAEETWQHLDEAVLKGFAEQCNELTHISAGATLSHLRLQYEERLEARKNKEWLLAYKGSNQQIISIQHYFNTYGHITPSQEQYAKGLILNETSPSADPEFDQAMSFLTTKFPQNTFYASVNTYYRRNGFVSPKQKKYIMRDYQNAISE